jgi:hypothetical protein
MMNHTVIPFKSDLLRRAFVPLSSALAVLALPMLYPDTPLALPVVWIAGVLVVMLLAIRSEPVAISIDSERHMIHVIYHRWLLKPMKSFDVRPFSIVRSYVRGQIPETVIVERATTEEVPRTIWIGMFPPAKGKGVAGTYSSALEPLKAAELRKQMESMGFENQGYLFDFKERRGVTLT